MFVSQPAVTKGIKRLEEFLGVKLFIRTSRGVVPTAEGEEFNRICYNSMQNLSTGINKILSLTKLESGTLNIGASSTIVRKLLMPFIKKFTAKYPNVILTITDANSSKLEKYTKNGTVDLSIISEPIIEDGKFEIIPLIKINDCFIANKNCNIDFLSIEELKTERIILQKRPSNNRDYFEKVCLENNIILSPILEIGSFGLITDFVANDMGIGFTVKEFIKDDIQNKRVKIIESELKFKSRNVCIITPKLSFNNFATKKFTEEIKDYFNSLK